MEDTITKAIRSTEGGTYLALDPEVIRQITEASSKQLERLISSGHHPVILCSAQVRFHLFNALKPSIQGVTVISYNEIVSNIKIESLGVVSLAKSKA